MTETIHDLVRTIQHLRSEVEKWKGLATIDPLTGLYNRRGLEMRLNELKEATSRAASSAYALLVADVNGLKQVNDTLGHAAGDELILRAAKIIHANVSASDLAARTGGDEFTIVLCRDNLTTAGVEAAMLRLRNLASSNALSLAIGLQITYCPPTKTDFAIADARMYADKMRYKKRI